MRCWKINGVKTYCTTQRQCVYSAKLRGVVCFHNNKRRRRRAVCFRHGGATRCYKERDLVNVKHKLVCKARKGRSRCSLKIVSFCVRSGRCYQIRAKGVKSVNSKVCAKVVILQVGLARLSMYCTKHQGNVQCKDVKRRELLERRVREESKKRCAVPKGMVECRRGHALVRECKVEVKRCEREKIEERRAECFRKIYAKCVTVIYAVRHYCDKQSLNIKFSAECVGVEQQELKCYMFYSQCRRGGKREECEREVELKCAEVTIRYIKCFFTKHTPQVSHSKKRHARSGEKPKPTPEQVRKACLILLKLKQRCGLLFRYCSRRQGKKRTRCFYAARKRCIPIFRYYIKYRGHCKPHWRRALRRQRKIRNGFCAKLFRYTRACGIYVHHCTELPHGAQRKECFKKIRACKRVFVMYQRYKNDCRIQRRRQRRQRRQRRRSTRSSDTVSLSKRAAPRSRCRNVKIVKVLCSPSYPRRCRRYVFVQRRCSRRRRRRRRHRRHRCRLRRGVCKRLRKARVQCLFTIRRCRRGLYSEYDCSRVYKFCRRVLSVSNRCCRRRKRRISRRRHVLMVTMCQKILRYQVKCVHYLSYCRRHSGGCVTRYIRVCKRLMVAAVRCRRAVYARGGRGRSARYRRRRRRRRRRYRRMRRMRRRRQRRRRERRRRRRRRMGRGRTLTITACRKIIRYRVKCYRYIRYCRTHSGRCVSKYVQVCRRVLIAAAQCRRFVYSQRRRRRYNRRKRYRRRRQQRRRRRRGRTTAMKVTQCRKVLLYKARCSTYLRQCRTKAGGCVTRYVKICRRIIAVAAQCRQVIYRRHG